MLMVFVRCEPDGGGGGGGEDDDGDDVRMVVVVVGGGGAVTRHVHVVSEKDMIHTALNPLNYNIFRPVDECKERGNSEILQ